MSGASTEERLIDLAYYKWSFEDANQVLNSHLQSLAEMLLIII